MSSRDRHRIAGGAKALDRGQHRALHASLRGLLLQRLRARESVLTATAPTQRSHHLEVHRGLGVRLEAVAKALSILAHARSTDGWKATSSGLSIAIRARIEETYNELWRRGLITDQDA